jgi:hypothetical protein
MNKRDSIKAIGGIGPGASNVRKTAEERSAAFAKVRESEKRRAANPGLRAYQKAPSFLSHCGD